MIYSIGVKNMKKILTVSLGLLTLVACTPTAGVPPVKYVGQSSEIIANIAQVCTQIQPIQGYNFYTVDGISNNGVTCVSKPVLGIQLLGVNAPIRVTFTALQNGNIVNVAGSMDGTAGEGRRLIDEVFKNLEKTFKRIP